MKKTEKIVRITEDCRRIENRATGQLGVYEGNYPRTAIVVNESGMPVNEYYLDYWNRVNADWNIPERKRGEPKPEGKHYFVCDNPRIRLADGSYIWGDECWWSMDVDASLPELQKEVDMFRAVYAAMIESMRTGE